MLAASTNAGKHRVSISSAATILWFIIDIGYRAPGA
jgi:hypothetical protein